MIKKIEPTSTGTNQPEWLTKYSRRGLEQIGEYLLVPRIKIVQKQADSALLDKFGLGDVIVSPLGVLIAPMTVDGKKIQPPGKPFLFTPILFWPEWLTTNPIEMRGQLPFIADRSLDPKSALAVKSQNPATRKEKRGTIEVRHVECLNFVVLVHDVEGLREAPMILSFAKSEHFTGQKFCNLISMRKASIFSGIYQAQANARKNASGEWFGLDISNPNSGSPWVTEEQYSAFTTLHEELQNVKTRGGIRAEDEELDEENGEPAPTGKF